MQDLPLHVSKIVASALLDKAREGELNETLAQRDPVRLVTTRGLFSGPPLALAWFEAGPSSFPANLVDAWALDRARAHFLCGAGDRTLSGAMEPFSSNSLILHAESHRVVVLCARPNAQALVAAITSAHRLATGGRELVTGVEALWPDEALLGRSPDLVRPPRFGILRESMGVPLLRGVKSDPTGPAYLPGFVEHCGACGENVATVRRNLPLCAACDELRSTALSTSRTDGVAATRLDDLNRLASGALACVWVTADPVGDLLEGLGGLDEVSIALGSVATALDATRVDLVERAGLPSRHVSLSVGVGSRCLLVPAGRGPDVVRRWVEGFEKRLTQEINDRQARGELAEGLASRRLRAGLVVAPPGTPLDVLTSHARSRSSSAAQMRALTAESVAPASSVDVEILGGSSLHGLSVDERPGRNAEGTRDSVGGGRPLPYPMFRRLVLDGLRLLRRVPRHELTQVRQALLDHPRAAELNWRLAVQRSEALRQYAQEMAGKDADSWGQLVLRTDEAAGPSLLEQLELACAWD